MKKYHGTSFGLPRVDVARVLAGRHALIPFTDLSDLGVAAEVCASFVFDNGAYSVWRKGGQLDRKGYYKWVLDWYRHPRFDWALIPDVIDGDEAANDALIDEWPAELRQAGVPVWHLHESTDRLVKLANEWPVVALGSSGQFSAPGSKIWWGRMREAMNEICDEYGRPICKLHGLRMLAPKVFTKLPLASADSTNAARNPNQLDRFGLYVPPTGAQRAAIICDRIESQNSASVFERTEAEFYAKFIFKKAA